MKVKLIILLILSFFFFDFFIGIGPSMSETIEDGDVLLCVQPLKIRKGRVYVFKSKSSASRFIIKRCVGVSGDTLVFKNMRIDDTSLQNSPKIELDYFRVYFSDFQDFLNFNKAVQNYKMIPDEDYLSCLVWINETDLNKIKHKLFSRLNYQRTTQIDSFIIKKSSKSFIPLSCYSDINIVDSGYFMLGDNNYVSTDSREFGTIQRRDIRSQVILRLWSKENKLILRSVSIKRKEPI